MFGYPMGSGAVSASQQFSDELMFALQEPAFKAAAKGMAKSGSLLGKTSAFMSLDERPGDNSFAQRYSFAQSALRMAAAARSNQIQHNDNSSEARIENINIHTAATDATGLAATLRQALNAHPLLNPTAQGTVALGTRANN
jgi:hypothetical protein